jgi:hypothetical protein
MGAGNPPAPSTQGDAGMTLQDNIVFIIAAIVWTLTLYEVPAIVIQFFRESRNEAIDVFMTIMIPVCMIGTSLYFVDVIF